MTKESAQQELEQLNPRVDEWWAKYQSAKFESDKIQTVFCDLQRRKEKLQHFLEVNSQP